MLFIGITKYKEGVIVTFDYEFTFVLPTSVIEAVEVPLNETTATDKPEFKELSL